MSENTNNQNNQQQPTTPTPEASGGQGGERTFTQSELDRIVQERLARDRASRSTASDRERDLVEREQKLAEREKAFETQQFNTALERALAAARAKGIKAVLPYLDMDKLSMKDGKITGLDEQFEELKKSAETAFLFEPESVRTTSLTHQYGGEGSDNDAFAAAFKPKGRK